MLSKIGWVATILFCLMTVAMADTAVCPSDPNNPPPGWILFPPNKALSKQAGTFSVAAVGMPAFSGVFCYYSSNQILISSNYTQAMSQNWSPFTCLKHPQVQSGQYTTCCDQSISTCTFN